MAHDSRSVANYFIERASELGHSLTPMQIIKLVYIAHGWNLAITGEDLINESVQAWKYGPVVESVYKAFKKYGNNIITDYAKNSLDQKITSNFKKEDLVVMEWVLRKYGVLNGLQLSSLTHKEDTPWYRTWHEEGGKNQLWAVINNDSIKEYYDNLADNLDKS